MVVLLFMIVQPKLWTQTILSSTPSLGSAYVKGSKILSHILQNKGPVLEDKDNHNAYYSLVLRPNCYTMVVTMSGI